MQFKRILVTSDLSDASKAAFKFACEETGAEMHVIHVLEEIELPAGMELTPESASKVKEDLVSGRREQLRKNWEENSSAKAEFHVVFSTSGAAQAICELASQIKADLIISASHGRGILQDLLVGSVTQRVLRNASCPVLVVPVK